MGPPDGRRLHLGAAWYPEQWPEDGWPADVRLMAEAGMSVVRMGEFAWSALQPDADTVDLDWLDRAIALLAESGIRIVLGTPTAAPPAWLVDRHPDLLAVDETSRRVQFGNRCHYCVTSPDLHRAAAGIAGELGRRFGANPNVIGWQIDNEYNRVCYCDRCREQFQAYLAARYESLDDLNERWSTRYWSQTYSAWAQIPLPIGPHNPGLMLAFRQFVTDSYRRFQRLQIEALRPHLAPDVWVTHNFMHWYGGYDHYLLSEDLDVASWDWYVETGHNDYLRSGAAHDLVRGFKNRTFWLMETQPGHVNWLPVNGSQRPGEARAMAWHAIAHGADAVLYWQWRSALGGQEQYHGTLIDQAGRPRPIFDEIRRLGGEVAAAAHALGGSTPAPAPVALLHSYPSRWSIEAQPHHADFNYVEHLVHHYRGFASRNIAVDIVSPTSDLAGYRVVVAPALLVLHDGIEERLRGFVRRGGHLVLTIRSAMKDADNAFVPARQPGPLADIAGVEVEEYYALLEPVPVKGNGLEGTTRIWAERLLVRDEGAGQATVLARFGSAAHWLAGHPAVTVHSFGEGLVYYVGAYLDEAAQQALTDRIVAAAGVAPVLDASSPGIEARMRCGTNGEEILIVTNHGTEPRHVILPWVGFDHLAAAEVGDELELGPHETAILTAIRES
jgi:beta-galactosidase